MNVVRRGDRRGDRRGFSLIETMVASAMFFVGLTAVFATFTTASNLLLHHRNVTRAVAIAESNLEQLIQRYPGDPQIAVGVTPTPRYYDRDGVLSATPAEFRVTWTVTTFAKLDGIREVTVLVRWYEAGVRERTLQLRTWRS
jgi:Tfp pilus assembly protein PilV